MAREFDGSFTAGCSTNASTCHPLAQFFGVWNEPNGTTLTISSLSTLLQLNGIKAANPSAYVVASDIGTGGSRCGGFCTCGNWKDAWMKIFAAYFSNYYDVISVHGYNSNSTDRSNIDSIWNSYDPGAKPIWMTETAYGSPTDVTQVDIDQHNRSYY